MGVFRVTVLLLFGIAAVCAYCARKGMDSFDRTGFTVLAALFVVSALAVWSR